MYFHKEGKKIIIVSTILFASIGMGIGYLLAFKGIVFYLVALFCIVMLYLIVQFFRVPNRNKRFSNNKLISPADGKLVVIEKVFENEYFKSERLQVSIFMSPLNVHVNWYPANGEVVYMKYHPGKYLVAWDPKSSTENERTTVVIKNNSEEIMIRQIAGAVARRIVCYSKVGDKVNKGDELGFIKFGSRVDLLLPIETKINIPLNSPVTGLITELN